MGQQQLILLVLATVIVGIAIVVGIRAFTENSAKSNADALTQDAVRMANDIQAWVKKPTPFGGAGAGEDWTDATLSDVGYQSTGGEYTNLNGKFVLAAGVINGYGFDGSTDSTAANAQQHIRVRVCGPSDTDLRGATLKIDGQVVAADAPAC